MQGRIIPRGVLQGTGLKIVPFNVFIDDPEKRPDGAMRKLAFEKVIGGVKINTGCRKR